MTDPGAIENMITAAARGASTGLETLRSAGVSLSLEGFAVEITYGERGPEASIVFEFTSSD